MADQIDAAVHPVQTFLGQPVLNRLATKTGGEQLATSYDAVLHGRDPRDCWIAPHARGKTAEGPASRGRVRSCAPSGGHKVGLARSTAPILQFDPLAGGDTPLPCRFSSLGATGADI